MRLIQSRKKFLPRDRSTAKFGAVLLKYCVGAGNAVRFGNSGAAVTGYETPIATHHGEGGAVGLMPEVRTTVDA